MTFPPWLSAFCDAIATEYRVVRPLGAGGMATVVLAEERALKRLVAIKVLSPELAEEGDYRTRFAREAEAAARLQHPNIVPIYRVSEAAGLPFYAMQYVEGETLGARMARDGRLDAGTAARVTRDVALALALAHRRGVVHRDVKPHNILLDAEDGRALVTDFGIARLMHDDNASATLTRDQLTGVGRLVGTPRYMSPEQASGGVPVGPPSDLYSLGVVLYEMLSGAYPYDEATGRNPMLAHVVDPVVPLAARGADVPDVLAQITERLLQKEPSARYASADELLAALGNTPVPGIASAVPTSGTKLATGAKPTRSRGWWLAGAAVVVLSAVAVGTMLRGGVAGAMEDPRRSLLVGYFDNTTRDPALEWLRIGGVELLARSLSRWTDLRVVETSRLLDLARKAKIEEGVTMSQSDVIRLARDAGAGTAGVGSILRVGTGRSSITLRLYDVRTDSLLTEATEEVVADSLLPDAFAHLADRVFSIAGAPQSALIDAEPPTRSLVAYRAYVSALRASNHWKLDSAEQFLRTAVEVDPTFALGWTRRAMNNVFRNGPFDQSAQFLTWSDSALKYASARPAKERLLIEGTHHLLSARYAEARGFARRLIALDSTSADAWWLLGFATLVDRYLIKDAAGRDSTGYDPTIILRAFQKALALDGSNHMTIIGVSTMLRDVTFERPGTPSGRTWLVRGRPKSLNDVSGNNVGAYYRAVLVTPDSFRFGPIAEVSRVTTPADTARSKSMAMTSLRSLLDLWLSVGADEAPAHYLRSEIAQRDKNFDVAFEALERAISLDVEQIFNPDWDRLTLALDARRDSLAIVVSGRLVPHLREELRQFKGPPGFASALANAQVLAGRLDAALVTEAIVDSAREAWIPRRITPFTMLADTLETIRTRAWSGRMPAPELAALVQRTDAFIASQPDSLRERLRTNLMAPLGFAAANLGDTATIARLRAQGLPSLRMLYPGISALAAALAGDRADAERWLARAAADTAFPWPGSRFSAGQAAQLIGRPADALRFHQSVDDASLNVSSNIDHDWIIFARSIKGRGDASLALGDTAAARRHYERFVRLWKDADAQFQPERDAAVAALASLKRGDVPAIRVIPR